MSYRRLIGATCLLLGIGLFSTIELGQKFLVQAIGTTIDSNVMVFVRFVITGLLLLACGLPSFYSKGHRLDGKALLIFLVNGFVGITLSINLFHYAIDQFQNASSAAVVFSANAVFVIIFARFINHESWTFGKWLAVVTGMAGICLFMFENGTPSAGTIRALLLMSVAAMLFALSVCFTKRVISAYGPMVYMGGSSLFGGLLALPFFFVMSDMNLLDAMSPMLKAPGIMAYYVLVATALAYWLLYQGIALMSAFEASMAFMLKPVLACILAHLTVVLGMLTGESHMNVATIAGTVLILLAMGLSQLCLGKCPEKKNDTTAEQTPHE